MTKNLLLFSILFFSLAFLSCAEDNNPSKSTKIVIISDLNESYGSTYYEEFVDSALAFIEREQPDVVFAAGDLIAGQSLMLSEKNIQEMWAAFDDVIGKFLRELDIPFITTTGNHDGSGSGNFDHERDIMKTFWDANKPEVGFTDDEDFPFNFSLKLNNLFIVVWDASTHIISEKQLNWTKNQFSSDEAKSANQRILIGHLPFYSVAEGRNSFGNVLSNPDSIFTELQESGLDLYISGHHHAYYPAQKDNTLLLAVGALGGGPRPYIGETEATSRTITLLEFPNNSDSFNLKTYNVEKNFEEIEIHALPDSLVGINGTIFRF